MITNVSIKNYKSVVDVSLPLGRFNLLIGANGCGKSNILEGIAMGAAASSDKLDYEYFANRLRYKQDEFARAMAQNPFFMASEEDRDRIHDEIAQARKNGGSITANLRFYRRDGNSFYYRMKGAPAYQADGGTVYYCVFQETTGFQMTTDRLQGRLDSLRDRISSPDHGGEDSACKCRIRCKEEGGAGICARRKGRERGCGSCRKGRKRSRTEDRDL